MTRKRDIERFVTASINKMEATITYVQGAKVKNDDAEKTDTWWRMFALDSIRSEYDGAFGALIFANVYAGIIDRGEYEELVDLLHDAKNRYEEQVWTRLI